MTDDNIKVTIKVRPLIKREKDKQLPKLWKVNGCSIQHVDSIGTNNDRFTFDHIFDEDTTTTEVFEQIAKPIVDATLKGFNGTIFAYGQTSSGKTYTMTGDDTNPGVMLLAIREIFREIESSQNQQFLLRIGYIEIYNEKLYDLLDKSNTDLKIQEKSPGEVSVNHREIIVSNEEMIMSQLMQGNKERKMAGTNMNERSSRSHTIFRIIIESSTASDPDNEDDRIVTTSYLNLVDLAGSERADQTGATGSRLKEAGSINKSLLSLSCVIQKLSTCESATFINYRDSKLTRILAASLGGNAMTAIICNITPAAHEETASTLNFGMSAKSIKNTPIVNEIHNEAILMKRLEKEINRLQIELKDLKMKNENYENVQKQLFERQNQILRPKRAAELYKLRRRTWAYQNPAKDGNDTIDPIPIAPIKKNSENSLECRASMSRLKPPQWNKNTISSRPFTAAPSTPIKSESHEQLGFLSPFTQLETPREWKHNKAHSQRSASPESRKDKRIEQLEMQLDDLRQFAKLERHVNPINPFDEPDDDSDEVAQLRRDLKLLKEQVEQTQQDRAELLMYRAGLMSINTTVNESVLATKMCDHDGLEERNEELMAQQAAMDAKNKELEQNVEHLSSEVKRLYEKATLFQSIGRQQEDELQEALRVADEAKQAAEQAKTAAAKAEQAAELAQRMSAGIEYEYEHFKSNAKRREHELVGLLDAQKQPTPTDPNPKMIELQAAMDKIIDELAVVRSEREMLTTQMAQATGQIETLRKEKEVLHMKIGEDKSETDQLSERIAEMEATLLARIDEIATLNQEIKARDEDKVPLETEVQSLRSQVTELTSQLDSVSVRSKEEVQRLETTIAELQLRENQSREDETEHAKVQTAKYEEMQSSLEEAKATIDRLVSENDELNKANQQRDNRTCEMEAMLVQKELSLVESNDKMHAITVELESMQTHLSQSTATNEGLVNELNSVKSKLSDCKSTIETLSVELGSTKSLLSESIEERSITKTQLAALQETSTLMIAERDELTQRIENANVELTTERMENQRVQELIETLNASTAVKSKELDSKETEIQILMNTIEEIRSEREAMLSTVRATSDRLDVLQMELDEMRIKNQMLEDERELKHANQDHSMQTDEQIDELDQKNSQLNELLNQVENLSAHRDDLIRQLESIRAEQTDTRDEVSDMLQAERNHTSEQFRIERDALSTRLITLEAHHLELQKHLEDMDMAYSNKIQILTETIQSLEIERDSLNESLVKIRTERDEMSTILETNSDPNVQSNGDMEILRRDLQSMREEHEKLCSLCERTKDELSKAMAKNETLMASLENNNISNAAEPSRPDSSNTDDDSNRLLKEEIDALSGRVAGFRRIFESLVYNCVSEPTEGDLTQDSYLQVVHDQIIAEIEGLLEKNASLENKGKQAHVDHIAEISELREQLVRTVDLQKAAEKLVATVEHQYHEARSECDDQVKILEVTIANNLELEERLNAMSSTLEEMEQNKILQSEELATAQDSLAKIKATNVELDKQLASLTLDRDHVRMELDIAAKRHEQLQLDLAEVKTHLEKETNKLELQLAATTADLDALRTLHEVLTIEKNELYTVVENNRTVIEQTEEECNSMRNSYMECMQSIKGLQEDNEALRESALIAELELDKVRQLCEQHRISNDEYVRQIDELKEKCSSLMGQISGEAEECRLAFEAKLSEVKRSLEEEREQGEKKQLDYECGLATARQELEQARKASECKTELETSLLLKKVEELTNEYDEVRHALVEQEKENRSLAEAKSLLSIDFDGMRHAMVAQEKEMGHRIEEDGLKMRQLEETIKELRSLNETLTESIQTDRMEAQSALVDQERILSQLRKENDELRQEADRLMSQAEALRIQSQDTSTLEKLSELERINQRINAKSATLQLANEDLSQQIQQLNTTLHIEKNTNQELNNRTDQLQQQMANASTEHAMRLSEEQQKCHELQQQIEQLQAQSAQRTEFEASLQYHKGLSDNLRQLNEKAKLEVSKAQQELVKNTAEHEARWSEAQQQYRDLQLQCQQLQSQLGQRSETEATLQYEKGVSESLRQLNEKAKHEVTQAQQQLEHAKAEIGLLSDRMQQELSKRNIEHAARLTEAEQKHDELQQQYQQLKAELGQRTESEATLQYQKGVSESLRQLNEKAKAEVAQANHLLECARAENRQLVHKYQTVSQELNEIRSKFHSEQSFQEKELKISELETDLQRARREESFRRQQLTGENDALRSKNQNMMKELNEIRGRQQKDRKNQRRSTHDESRLMANEVNADVATQTDRACACAEMEAKLKKINGDLLIKDCHIARYKMMLDNNSIHKENVELKKQLEVNGDTIKKLRSECLKSNTPAAPVSQVDQSQQTESVESPPRAMTNESEISRLQMEAVKINKKYQIAKRFCKTRMDEVIQLKEQLQLASGTRNGEFKENTPDNNTASSSSDISRLQSEIKRLQYENVKLQDHLTKSTDKLKNGTTSSTASCNCHEEETRLKQIIDDMDAEMSRNEENCEALKKLLSDRNRQIQILEAKINDTANS